MEFINGSDEFPKHFVISRAIAERCLDYLYGETEKLKLDKREWVPLAISIAESFQGKNALEKYKREREVIENEFSAAVSRGDSKNRDIFTVSSMPEDKLTFILGIAIAEVGPMEFMNNQRKAVETLQDLCELGFVILRDIWNSPSYHGMEEFPKALALVAKGETSTLLIQLA